MKDSFVLYCSLREPLKKLSENEAGSLFKAILDYAAEGIEPDGLSQAAGMAFLFIRAQLERDNEKYEAICHKRAEAGRIGGLQKQANIVNATKCKQEKANVADNDTDNDNDNVSDNGTETVSDKKYSDAFLSFWEAYPRKADKGQAYKKFRERIKDGFPPGELIEAAKTYRIECETQKTAPQYIKHAKTFLGEALPFVEYIPKPVEKDNFQQKIQNGENPFR
jgi:hypothetical protein